MSDNDREGAHAGSVAHVAGRAPRCSRHQGGGSMTNRFSIRRSLLAGMLVSIAIALPGAAQQQPAAPAAPTPPAAQQPLPPGSPLIGRPNTEAAMKIAPFPVPPTPTPVDKLPLAKLKLPKGFNIELYVSGIH